jgi:hypothetical protein
MSPRDPDVPEQVRQYAPKEKPPPEPKEAPPRSDGDVLDQAGQAIVGPLQHAAKLSNETRDRAMESKSRGKPARQTCIGGRLAASCADGPQWRAADMGDHAFAWLGVPFHNGETSCRSVSFSSSF